MPIFNNPAQLADWGRGFAKRLRDGDVIALVGPLGAGKTTLVQSIVSALGYKGSVSSPTFALANEYVSRSVAVYHMDMYRLSPQEIDHFPLEDYWSGGISLIEWADKIRHRWPAGTLELEINILGPSKRELRVVHPNAVWRKRLSPLMKAASHAQ